MKWVTREHVHVDRVACPWIIKRFIDPDAVIEFVGQIHPQSPMVFLSILKELNLAITVTNVHLTLSGKNISLMTLH